jgi:aconitate hydratase
MNLDNLVNFGIVPLTFANQADYDLIKDGDILIVEDIQEVLGKEVNTARVRTVTQGAAYAVNCNVQARQRAIIKAGGGLLNFTKTGSKA